MIFEALTGERASSHLELRNEGSTAIFFSWRQLPLPHSFPNLRSQTNSQHFYFDSSSGTHKHNQTSATTALVSHIVCPMCQPKHIFQLVLNPPLHHPASPPIQACSFQVTPSRWSSYLSQSGQASKLNCGSSTPTLCCCREPPCRSH